MHERRVTFTTPGIRPYEEVARDTKAFAAVREKTGDKIVDDVLDVHGQPIPLADSMVVDSEDGVVFVRAREAHGMVKIGKAGIKNGVLFNHRFDMAWEHIGYVGEKESIAVRRAVSAARRHRGIHPIPR